MFELTPLRLSEVLLIEHRVMADERGFLTETFRLEEFAAAGLPRFVQENHSRSVRGVVRGLHFQRAPRAVGKLVRCVRGRVLDIAVDIRRGSPTYGQWVSVELSDERPAMLYVPEGFAHGICTLSAMADVLYKLTDYYAPELDRAVRWNDPAIGIRWPVADAILSTKDAHAPLLADVDNNLEYGSSP